MSDVAPRAGTELGVSKRSSGRYANYVFGIMFAISFLNFMDRNVFSAAANTIATELHLGIDQIGFIAFGFTIVNTLGALPLGVWADRAKRKNVVALCVTIWSLATAFTALANNFLSLFVSRMVLGIGEAGYFPAGTALMSDYFSREKRSRVWYLVAYQDARCADYHADFRFLLPGSCCDLLTYLLTAEGYASSESRFYRTACRRCDRDRGWFRYNFRGIYG